MEWGCIISRLILSNLLFDMLSNSYICCPNLAIANVSESSINHEKPFFTETEIGYYNLCFDNIHLTNYNLLYSNLLDLSLLRVNDTTETFIYRCITNKYKDNNKSIMIFKRFVTDFFTIDDLKQILSKKSLIELTKIKNDTQILIEPNNLSL